MGKGKCILILLLGILLIMPFVFTTTDPDYELTTAGWGVSLVGILLLVLGIYCLTKED